jgi:NAD(P)-dependent dehydrogenase (short-subunit alcohol dehydrogenase family)
LITGATSGLGEALAMQFAAEKFRIIVASRNADKVAATCRKVEQAGGEAMAVTLDVNKKEDFERVAEKVRNAWGGIDLLFNNAGIMTSGKVEETGLQEWEASINTDLWGVIHGCRAFLPLLSGGGHVANVASAAGLLGVPDLAPYGVAKAGVVSLSEAMAVELAEKKIEVSVSCPTVFKSALVTPSGNEKDLISGVTGEGLRKGMEATSVSSDAVARHLLRTMVRRRLYSLPQMDAKVQWWLCRMFPQTFRNLILYLYSNRLWVFADSK